MTVTLTDGDPLTDGDGTANGIIKQAGAIALPEEIRIAPSADTSISSWKRWISTGADRQRERRFNFGASGDLMVMRGRKGPWIGFHDWIGALIRFDLPALPVGIDVVAAQLSLYNHSPMCYRCDPDEEVAAYRMEESWEETEANWYEPCSGCQLWNKRWDRKGKKINYNPEPTDVQTVRRLGWFSQGWVAWDVTADILLFLEGTENNGWLLKSAEKSRGDIKPILFYSREASQEELRPYLLIRLTQTLDASK